jgi:cationic peptide transport system permease protein
MFHHHDRKTDIPSNFTLIWRIFKKRTSDVIGLYILIIMLLIIFVLPMIISTDPLIQNPNATLLPPSWVQGGEIKHFFGTDEFGRDLLSRLLIGGQNTIKSAFLASTLAMFVGCFIGLLSATNKRSLQRSFLHHMFDILSSIPSILLALIFAAILSPSLSHTMFAIALSQVPRFIHSTYFAVCHELSKEYIITNIQDGASNFRITRETILPNILDIIAKNLFQAIPIAIVDISAIGFIGFGAQPPTPEWGNMLASGMDLLFIGSYMAIIPGISIMLFIISIYLVGHGVHRVLQTGVSHGISRR